MAMTTPMDVAPGRNERPTAVMDQNPTVDLRPEKKKSKEDSTDP
jgi:hypothetical protein